MTQPKCGVCRFWQSRPNPLDDPSGEWGVCRRHPPTVLQHEDTIETHWPETSLWQWCGAFEAVTPPEPS